MEKTMDNIWRRSSVREFTGAPVTEEQVQSLLEAAMAAPSACCKDPWEFIVLREKEMLKAVSECLPNGHFLAKAPLGIIVCGDIRQAHSESLSYLLQDCAAATEYLLLAASALGLGACWLGIHPREERITALRKLFQATIEIFHSLGDLPHGQWLTTVFLFLQNSHNIGNVVFVLPSCHKLQGN